MLPTNNEDFPNKIDYIERSVISMDMKENENFIFQIITNPSLFNKKRTKIISKDNYFSLIAILKEAIEKELCPFLNYLSKIDISIFKILVNGFIEFDFDDKNKEIILEIIAKCINICFNKNLFYFIYKKLSKFFRRHEKFKDINSIQKFEKVFAIWKLLYNLENLTPIDQNNETTSIIFFPNLKKKNQNIKIEIERFKEGKNHFFVTINFVQSPILNINKYIKNFSFLKVYNDNKNKFKYKYKDIFTDEVRKKFNNLSQIYKIQFEFQETGYKIEFNDDLIILNNTKYNFDSISKMTLLNYFYGDISSIIIKNENTVIEDAKKKLLEIEITKNDDDVIMFDISLKDEYKFDLLIEDNLVNYKSEILSIQSIYDKNFKRWKRGAKDLSEIEYFGGLNSFIPLFKIIKYVINYLYKPNYAQKEEDYINKALDWIKDILKIIIKLICLSEDNYANFEKIIIPLIGSLSEIVHVLNELYSSKQISSNYKDILFNDQIIYDLLIILVNSKVQTNIILAYQKIFEINTNFENISSTIDYSLIINLDKIKNNKNIYWYFKMIYSYINFILLYCDSAEAIPLELITHLNSIPIYLSKDIKDGVVMDYLNSINPFVSVINKFYYGEKDDLNTKFISFFNLFEENEFYFSIFILYIKIILNAKDLLSLNKIKNENNFISKEINLISKFEFKMERNEEIIKKRLKDFSKNFKEYYKHMELLLRICPFLTNEVFCSEEEMLMNELINFHGSYHKLIKELFIFNRLWSNQKLFFDCTLEGRRKSNLKYKNINYYTNNFQRPIIYPVLDYKYRYPFFTKFSCDKYFYRQEESKDDYNFDFDSPELDKFVDEYNEKLFKEIRNNKKIQIYKACRIKQQYHIKGNLFLVNINGRLLLYFHGYPYDFENNTENTLSCNKINEENKLCFGSIFKCPEKEKNTIINLNLKAIRLFLKRIYYYRKSAIEIFNLKRSYYFNFFSEKEFNTFIESLNSYFSKAFFPININKNILGYINIKLDLNKSDIAQNNFVKNNDFIKFISQKTSYGELFEMSNFDLILLMNLISNRSYIDLHQYPIFPILFFYDKNAIVKRDLKEHIGFQTETDSQRKRKESITQMYKSNKEEGDMNDLFYFNTHYSNIVYTSNYMIRLFPYSFLSIELQGNGFDNPNRLFFSIEDTLSNISTQKSDLRELIPEFFYLPEMFMNLNYINFGKKSDNKFVDNVQMPLNIIGDIPKDKNSQKNDDVLKYFLFVNSMKNQLEMIKIQKLNLWLDIIFGEHQKYGNRHKEKKQYFRNQSYIDIDKDTYQQYLNTDIIMKSVEFGLIPLQTIHDNKSFENRKNNYDKFINNKSFKIKDFNISYWGEKKNIQFRMDENRNFGKLEIFYMNKYICKIVDHNDEIIDLFYNQRLNMFATTSFDGFVLIYILPNKLFSSIKHPSELYFTNVYLISNPFPAIITFDNNDNILRSYSLSGILIKEQKIKLSKIKINPIFNINGGAFKDRLEIYDESNKNIILYDLPFFNDVNSN